LLAAFDEEDAILSIGEYLSPLDGEACIEVCLLFFSIDALLNNGL
jgi:hypothetical protein